MRLTVVSLGEYSISPEEQCRYLYESLTSLPVSLLPPVSDVQRQVHRLMLAHGSARPELKELGRLEWLNSQIPLRVPLLLQPQELADTSVSDLLRRFKGGLLCAMHAMLNGQRILFLGHNQPATTVCMAVLSLPLMVRTAPLSARFVRGPASAPHPEPHPSRSIPCAMAHASKAGCIQPAIGRI